QISQLVVNVAVKNQHVAIAAADSRHPGQVQGVSKIQDVTKQGQVPAADVLVATLHWLAGSAHASLAAISFVHKAFTHATADNHIVPKGEQTSAQSASFELSAQILDLRALSRAIYSGKAHEDSTASGIAGRHRLAPISALPW